MKKLLHEYKFVLVAYALWAGVLFLISWVSTDWWQIQFRFLGPISWANFDGVHYLGIASRGYGLYQQAFFPLYPLVIFILHRVLPFDMAQIAMFISLTAFLGGLCSLYTYVQKYGERVARWTIILILLYPMSFSFASVYTEGLYFFLAVAALLAVERKKYVISSIIIALAGATRFIGITLSLLVLLYARTTRSPRALLGFFAISATGLLGFMFYLWYSTGDPLAFMHVQSFFGANRSGSSLVLPPQVLWRYIKIMLTASPFSLQYWIAMFEASTFIGAITLIVLSWKDRALRPQLVYSMAVLLIPSMTGTFSSMPRYVLGAFPLFIILAKLHNRWVTWCVAGVFALGLVICTSLFLGGYFVS